VKPRQKGARSDRDVLFLPARKLIGPCVVLVQQTDLGEQRTCLLRGSRLRLLRDDDRSFHAVAERRHVLE
jgi:hypothetical protein